jgi:hypothetical protein
MEKIKRYYIRKNSMSKRNIIMHERKKEVKKGKVRKHRIHH